MDIPDETMNFDFASTSSENKNTKRKTETDMRIFSSYLISLNEIRPIEALSPIELDRYLTTFFSVIKKHDGNEYEPASLRGMLCSVERYIRTKNYPSSVTRDAIFVNTRNMLKEKQKLLKELSKTQKKKKQDSMTASTVERLKQLYNAKEFGPYSPTAIINSLCFAFVIHLKIRKAVDHKQLLWGDVILKSNGTNEYLCYEPLQDYDFIRPKLSGISQFRIYAQTSQDSSIDPVYIYKMYASKRPYNMMSPDSPFYLGIAVVCNTMSQQPQWFKPSPMGVNKLSDLVRMIRDITGSLSVVAKDKLDDDLKNISHEFVETSLVKQKSESTESSGRKQNTNDASGYDSTNEEEDDEVESCNSEYKCSSGEEAYHDSPGEKKYCDAVTEKYQTAPNQLDTVKKTIRESLNLLDTGGKSEILSWLSTLKSTTDESTETEEENQTFVVKLSLTTSQMRSQTPFTVSADVKPCFSNVQEVAKEPVLKPSDEKQSLDRLSATLRKSDKNQTIACDILTAGTKQSVETLTINQRKRALSESFARNAKHLRDQSSRRISVDNRDTHAEAGENIEKITSKHTLPVPVYPFDLPSEYTSLFPPWTAVDPRVAFFMRHGLIAGYPNIVQMENHIDIQKPTD